MFEADSEAPNVDVLGDAPAKTAAPKKSAIGSKKPAAKKGGLGAKKGLGASRATKDFASIEAEAEMADQVFTSRMAAKVYILFFLTHFLFCIFIISTPDDSWKLSPMQLMLDKYMNKHRGWNIF